MSNYVELLENIADLGLVFKTVAPINKQYRVKPFGGLEIKGAGAGLLQNFECDGLTSLRNVSLARIASENLRFGTRINLTPIYVKGKKPLFVKGFVIGQQGWLDAAVEANKKSEYLVGSSDVYDAWVSTAKSQTGLKPELRTAMEWNVKDGKISMDSDEARNAFEDQRKGYKIFVPSKLISVYLISAKEVRKIGNGKAIYNYLWFTASQYGSSLDCRGRILDNGSRAFGVLETGVATAPNLRAQYAQMAEQAVNARKSKLDRKLSKFKAGLD